MCLINEGHSAILNDKAEAARCHLLFSSVFKLLSKWTTAVRARCCDPFRKIRKWWNPKFQSVMDVSSRFGVCVRSPSCTWCYLHSSNAFSVARESERNRCTCQIRVTIWETVYNYPFVSPPFSKIEMMIIQHISLLEVQRSIKNQVCSYLIAKDGWTTTMSNQSNAERKFSIRKIKVYWLFN